MNDDKKTCSTDKSKEQNENLKKNDQGQNKVDKENDKKGDKKKEDGGCCGG